ncbi:MAG: DUF493 domain-containing protein [Ignavibacteria bacterium]|nr:DUF493 domain-containing protein [Ignavibacteria bacterium]
MNVKKNLNGNTNLTDISSSDNQIEFPVTYVLKVVVTLIHSPEVHQHEIEKLLKKQEVLYRFMDAKKSSKGSYISFSIKTTLINKEQMDRVYEDLKALPGIKFAV